MKKFVSILIFYSAYILAFPQGMSTRVFNFSTFSEDKKLSNPLQDKLSSEAAKKHPEYGIRPYNSQCIECVELIDQRTEDGRQFIDPKRAGHTYSQQSYFPLHYKDQDGRWRTIDPRLRPVQGHPGLFTALYQTVPVKFDLADHFTSLDFHSFEFIHNHDLRMYFVADKNDPAPASVPGDYSHYTIGDDGCRVYDIWPGIDMEMFARTGNIETNFIIGSKPNLLPNKGYMVIEDHVSLPQGFSMEKAGGSDPMEAQDLIVRDPEGRMRVRMAHVRIRNADNLGTVSEYVVQKQGDEYNIRMLVPCSILDISPTSYPVVVDPIVYGYDTLGNFASTGKPSAGMLFTKLTVPPGHCDYHMTVTVPGQSQLVNSYVDLETTTQADPYCTDPLGISGVVCLKREVLQTVVSDTCGNYAETFSCFNSTNCDTPGTTTTDPAVIPGAGPILLSPHYLCSAPQCPDFELPFTLENSDSTCRDTCNSHCAIGNRWKMLIEACQIDAYITALPATVCAGQPVTLTCYPSCGVPPYHYMWSNGMTGQTITIYPQSEVIIGCTAYDTCDNYAITNDTTIFVLPSPPADAGPGGKVCEGGTITLGGSPTTSPNTTISWIASPPAAQSWISNPAAANPTLTIPAGTIDTTFYIVRTDSAGCFRLDTAYVYSIPNPVAVIDSNSSTRICNGQSVTISANGPFSSYLWNTGATGQSITVSAPGSYYVVVTDSNDCRDTSNTVAVTQIQVPDVQVFPDTLIFYGDSVGLYANISLSPPAVDSFFWSPDTFINCTTCPDPIVAPIAAQSYILTVYTQGCVLTDSALISVILPDQYYIPNAFTPNGDGINDSFYVYYQSGVTVKSCRIYDRWGEKVHDGTYPWDGRYRGELCQPGVYVYVFSLTLFGKQNGVIAKGSVTIIR